jgi:hypothetical protein
MQAMDEEEDRLYVPYAEGELGEDAEKVGWVLCHELSGMQCNILGAAWGYQRRQASVLWYLGVEVLQLGPLMYLLLLSPPQVWVIPGEKYAVTLTSHSPFIELTARQTRTVGWELDPFVFYVRRKVSESSSAPSSGGTATECQACTFMAFTPCKS